MTTIIEVKDDVRQQQVTLDAVYTEVSATTSVAVDQTRLLADIQRKLERLTYLETNL